MNLLYLTHNRNKGLVEALHKYFPSDCSYEVMDKADESLNLSGRDGVVIVGSWREIFSNDQDCYFCFLDRIKKEKIKLASIVESCEMLTPQDKDVNHAILRESGKRSVWSIARSVGRNLNIPLIP